MVTRISVVAAVGKFEVVTRHIKTELNRVPDILSRMDSNEKYKKQFQETKQQYWKQRTLRKDYFMLNNNWQLQED